MPNLQPSPIDRLYVRWYVWCNRWTRSQLIFLFVVAMIPLFIALYAANRFVQARQAALYWQEKAIQNLIPNDK